MAERIDLQEAARRLGVHYQTAYRWVREGRLTAVRVRGRYELAVEDAIFALEWAKSIGGNRGLIARTDANADALDRIVAARPWLGHLADDPASRSKTSVCLTVEGADEAFIKAFAGLLEKEKAAYDIAGYRDEPPGLRIWCGATVDSADIEALGPWLDHALEQTK